MNVHGHRRSIAVILLGAVVLAGIAAFPAVMGAGTKFLLGDTPPAFTGQVSAGAGADPAASEPWVQDNYSDDIQQLGRMAYYVTQQNGTEPPFKNALYDEERPGIYVDVVSGEPLFASIHKFDSGTGWPSFYKPLEPDNIVRRRDPGPVGDRIEVSSRHAGSHLGHVFSHRGTPTGLRYCINSAALEFVPADELEERGYGEYASLF